MTNWRGYSTGKGGGGCDIVTCTVWWWCFFYSNGAYTECVHCNLHCVVVLMLLMTWSDGPPGHSTSVF